MLLLAPRVGGARAVSIACAIAALIEERDILSDPRNAGAHVLPRVTALLATSPGPGVDEVRWVRARRGMAELRQKIAEEMEVGEELPEEDEATRMEEEEMVGVLLAIGFPDRVAQLQKGKSNSFSLANGRAAAFASNSELLGRAPYIVAGTQFTYFTSAKVQVLTQNGQPPLTGQTSRRRACGWRLRSQAC
jgi:ATP-dependent helicase HrpB